MSSGNGLGAILNPMNEPATPAAESASASNSTSTSAEEQPQRRTKVSRACDCCRRKKIKCDGIVAADTQKPRHQCTNCSKTGEVCEFTRVPLKRGPMKGYNKKKPEQLSPPASAHIPKQISPVILPPLNSIQVSPQNAPPMLSSRQRSNSNTSTNNNAANNAGGMTLFWKPLPTDLPTSISSRRVSIDSDYSFGSNGSRKRLSKPSSPYQSSDYSDSDEEYSNPKRFNRPFQIPSFDPPMMVMPNRTTPRNSITQKMPQIPQQQHHHGSVSSSVGSINRGFQNLMNASQITSSSPTPISSPILSPSSAASWPEIFNNVNNLLDVYFNRFHQQYPLIPTKDILNNFNQLDNTDINHLKIAQIFESSLNILTNKGSIKQIDENFQIICSFALNNSFIKENLALMEIFTTSLSLLNFSILSLNEMYSFGFTVSFGFFRDWLTFNGSFNDLNFNNLINVVLFDNLFSLNFGTPRCSTICFSIDENFISNYLKNSLLNNNQNLEYFNISFDLLVYGNKLQNVNSIENFLSLGKPLGLEFKFIQILNINNELVIYCQNILQQLTEQTEDQGDEDQLNDFLLNAQLNFSKFIKKINNTIDEQIDDLEMFNNHPLVSIILIKCFKILRNLKFFIKSILKLNDFIQLNSNNDLNDPLNPSFKFIKINELINLNLNRCFKLNFFVDKKFDNLIKILIKINDNYENFVVDIKKISISGKLIKKLVLLNWIRSVNEFWTSQISIDGMSGWSAP